MPISISIVWIFGGSCGYQRNWLQGHHSQVSRGLVWCYGELARIRHQETMTDRSPHPPAFSDGTTRSTGARASMNSKGHSRKLLGTRDWAYRSWSTRLGITHQDRREGRQPRPSCRLPDSRGRHFENSVDRYPAADLRTAAASASPIDFKCSIVLHSIKNQGRDASR